MSKIKIFTDGGARGNPGPAGIGIVITGLSAGKQVIGEFIGKTTNNEAEYRALIVALQKVIELSGGEDLGQIDCYSDSELMVKQLNGEYKVKDMNLRELFLEVLKLKSEIKVPITFSHVRREKNVEADAVLNEVLDAIVGKKFGEK
jgi:ribonuclease HI